MKDAAHLGPRARRAVHAVVVVATLVPIAWFVFMLGGEAPRWVFEDAWSFAVLVAILLSSALFWRKVAVQMVAIAPAERLVAALAIGFVSPLLAPLLAVAVTWPLLLFDFWLPQIAAIPKAMFGAMCAPFFLPLQILPVGMAMGLVTWLLTRAHHEPRPVVAAA